MPRAFRQLWLMGSHLPLPSPTKYVRCLPRTVPFTSKRFHTAFLGKQGLLQKPVNERPVSRAAQTCIGKQETLERACMGSRPETLSRFWISRFSLVKILEIKTFTCQDFGDRAFCLSRFWRSRPPLVKILEIKTPGSHSQRLACLCSTMAGFVEIVTM